MLFYFRETKQQERREQFWKMVESRAKSNSELKKPQEEGSLLATHAAMLMMSENASLSGTQSPSHPLEDNDAMEIDEKQPDSSKLYDQEPDDDTMEEGGEDQEHLDTLETDLVNLSYNIALFKLFKSNYYLANQCG